MKISNWLAESTNKLEATGSLSARLDCLLLLQDCLSKDKAWILANPDDVLNVNQLDTLNKQLNRRSKNEPLAYIRGKSEFYGHSFVVDKHVLIPRPESEDLVTEAISISDKPFKVLDVGTGSGALAISIALNSSYKVYGSDIDNKALSIAKLNAKKLNAAVEFKQNDLLNNVNTHYEIIVGNLPYVSKRWKKDLQAELDYEPEIALWVDGDGLDLYRKFFFQIKNMLFLPQHVITESLLTQHEIMIKIASKNDYKHLSTTGLAQHFIKS